MLEYLHKFYPYLKILFATIVFLAILSCYVKADYNLPLFIFALLAWNIEKV